MGMFNQVRHKVFISYHHADQGVVDDFVKQFDQRRQIFIRRVLGGELATDVTINSTKTEYVMRRIRELYLEDSTVTIVMIGENTWGRRYVDWEIASSLRQGPVAGAPNGLIGILLPGRTTGKLPDRFYDNYAPGNSGYGKFYRYPTSAAELKSWIDSAFHSRLTRRNLIKNGRLLRQRNSPFTPPSFPLFRRSNLFDRRSGF